MRILIKGMEMPDNCEKCPFLDYEQGFCFASGRKGKGGWYDVCLYSGSREFNTMRNPKCPLIEVPTPHGRLIDADKLYKWIKAECNPYGKPRIGYEDGNKVLDIIKAASTVIEAEK